MNSFNMERHVCMINFTCGKCIILFLLTVWVVVFEEITQEWICSLSEQSCGVFIDWILVLIQPSCNRITNRSCVMMQNKVSTACLHLFCCRFSVRLRVSGVLFVHLCQVCLICRLRDDTFLFQHGKDSHRLKLEARLHLK